MDSDSLNLGAKLRQQYHHSQMDGLTQNLDQKWAGLSHVKQCLYKLAAYLLIEKIRKQAGLQAERPGLHMCFSGNPGTGKTMVAHKVAEILHALGYLPQNKLVMASRETLVGEYIGHTAPKTKEMLKQAQGGVLFIDEAYGLVRSDNNRDYGAECIEVLLQTMTQPDANIVIIFAGYPQAMEGLFQSNPGLFSRISHHIPFPDYTTEELSTIGLHFLEQWGYYLDPAAKNLFGQSLQTLQKESFFSNARSVQNLLNKARLHQAARIVETLVAQEDWTEQQVLQQIKTIQAHDINRGMADMLQEA